MPARATLVVAPAGGVHEMNAEVFGSAGLGLIASHISSVSAAESLVELARGGQLQRRQHRMSHARSPATKPLRPLVEAKGA
jgi:hypothetical protein